MIKNALRYGMQTIRGMQLTLGTKFIALIVVILAIMLGIFNIYELKEDKKVFMQNLVSKNEALGQFTALISSEAVLAFDLVTLKSYVREVSRDKDIVYGVIQGADGVPLTAYLPANNDYLVSTLQNGNSSVMETIASIEQNTDIFLMEFPIIFDEVKIGSLKLGVTRKFVDTAIAEATADHLLQFGLVIIALSGAIYIAFRFMALKPIRLLIAALERVGKGDLSEEVVLRSNDEIGELAVSLNTMMRQLRVSLAENKHVTAQLREKANELKYLNADLERLVMERTCELANKAGALQRSNQELDQFAYIASHDFKAPLRAIANLSQWIEEDLEEVMTDATRKQMALLRSRVQRMDSLINGVLQYSRVGRIDMEIEEVDVGQLLVEIIDGLTLPPGLQINISPNMPTLQTARGPLFQVFSNLLFNAIKYHDHPETGQITVTTRTLDETYYEFSITDDGPGIAPEYHDKVFQIFQTLNARDKVESTGVGLTVVKKIVEQLGGEITLDSAEGKGSSFRFSVPKTRYEEQTATNEVDSENPITVEPDKEG